MGGPMCRRLAAAGYAVTAHDMDADALAAAAEAGASTASSSLGCARDSDLCMTSLPGPPQVEAVMAGPGGALGAMRPGSVWVDLTTNSRELVLELAATAPDGVAVVDSPVTGAVDGARRGELTLFVGGEPEAVAKARTVLEHRLRWARGSRWGSPTAWISGRYGRRSSTASATALSPAMTPPASSRATTTRRSRSHCASRTWACWPAWSRAWTPTCR